MDAKKHFWVDYLACLIFGAVIVPLYHLGHDFPQVSMTTFFLLVALCSIVHIVSSGFVMAFCGFRRWVLVLFYFAWGCFWFSLDVSLWIRHQSWMEPVVRKVFPYKFWCVGGVCLVFLSFVVFYMRRSSWICLRVNNFFKKYTFILLLILSLNALYTIFMAPSSLCTMPVHSLSSIASNKYPNIYHVLLDAHVSQKGAEVLGGDLKPFYEKLEALGFVTYPESRAQFPDTLSSVVSMFNFGILQKVPPQWYRGFLDSSVLKGLLGRGYSVRLYLHNQSLYGIYGHSFESFRGSSILKEIIMLRFILEQTIVGKFFNWCFERKFAEVSRAYYASFLEAFAKGKLYYGNTGNFFYVHLLAPHDPYVFAERMEIPTVGLTGKTVPIVMDNVYGVDRLVLPIVEGILFQYKDVPVKPIIILHGDHGIVRSPTQIGLLPYVTEDTVYGNLLAIYMPDEWKKDAKDLKFINLYRFIFNHLFGTNYEYLPDVRKNEDGSIFTPPDHK